MILVLKRAIWAKDTDLLIICRKITEVSEPIKEEREKFTSHTLESCDHLRGGRRAQYSAAVRRGHL